jgi:hypothetical protein
MSIEVITNNYFESSLDFGVDTTDQSVHYVDDTVIDQNMIPNPFYIGFNGGSLSKQERKVMYTYNSVIVLLNNNLSTEFIEQFFQRTIDTNTLKQFPLNSVQYKRVSINILKNKQFYFKTNIVSDKHMNMLFPNDKFNPEELVFSMFELEMSNAIEYLKMYTDITEITRIKLPLQLAKTYNKHGLQQVSKNISRMFFDLKDNDFWTKLNSCKLNITNMFTKRDFQSRTGNNNFVVLAQSPDREKQATVDGDSKSYPSTRNKFEQFCDISSILKDNKDKTRTFYATIPDTQVTDKDVLDILKTVDSEKYIYELTNNMLISKEYCHNLFTKDILEYISKVVNKYPGIYKYTFGYAMLTLYLEECLFLTKSTKNSRFVFDINTANKLPTFPFISQDLKLNPYVSVLIHNDNLDMKSNACGIKYIENYDGYGVCNLETFKKRMNIFISGDVTKDVFANINMKEYGVSGSIIAACLQKRNPLYDAYIHEYKDENIAFKHFIDNYYGNSDIDIMCNVHSYTEYIMKSYDFYMALIKNISPNSTNDTTSDKTYSYDTVRTVGITLSDEFFKETLEDFNMRYGTTWTLEEYMSNCKDIRFRMYLHSKYYNFKMMSNEQLYRSGKNTSNEFLNVFMQPLTVDQLTVYYSKDETYKFVTNKDTDFIFYTNDFRKESNKLKENENNPIMKIGEAIRFKLTFKTMNKTFELFNRLNHFKLYINY